MFNPERILGGLIRGGMRRTGGGLGTLLSGGAALGLIGVAMEAAEHFMNRPQSTPLSTGAPPVPPPRNSEPGALSASVTPPPTGAPTVVPSPPIPGSPACPPPAPPGSMAMAAPMTPARTQSADAVLLIRAMIAAANADGTIDEKERSLIVGKLQQLELSREEHQFIIGELLAPRSRQGIVADVSSTHLARQVYLASVLAIEVDTDVERQYLKALAQELALDLETVEDIHRKLEVALP